MSPDGAARSAREAMRQRTHALDDGRVALQVVVGAPERGAPVAVEPGRFLRALPKEWHDLVPGVSQPHAALARAVGNAKKGAVDEGGDHWLWRKLGVDGSTLVFALVKAKGDAAARTWEGDARVTVEVAKAPGSTLKVSGSVQSEAVRAELRRVADRFDRERTRLTQADVRDVVNGVLLKRLKGVRLGGTTSFVLPKGADRDERALDLAPALNLASVDVVVTEVFGAAGKRMGGALRRGLMDEVASVASEARDLVDDLDAGKGVKSETVLDRLEQLRAVVSKAEALEGLIELGLDDVRAAAAAVRETVLRAVSEVACRG